MIGNPSWFKRRKYGGWGLFPATWQGWVYLAVFATLVIGIQLIPGLNEEARMFTVLILAIILIADTIDMMIRMKKDERETMHEAIAERNALWAILFVLTAGVAYQAAQSVILKDGIKIDPVIIIAIFLALIVKAVTNLYLDKKN